MIYKGFKFGMLLQLAIGPICIFIFQAATTNGFLVAEVGVLGVALIDALYILASIIGIGALIERNALVKVGLKYFGATILVLFGISNILNNFEINFMPDLHLQDTQNSYNMFAQAAILTLSNPLTILFWAGAFSSKIAEENFHRADMFLFGFGAIIATLFFMTFVVLIGSITKTFLPVIIIKMLNGVVGMVLIYFGIKTCQKQI